MKITKILVLGASGLIGSTLCRQLSDKHNVTGTYRLHKTDLSVPLLPFDVSSDDISSLLEQEKPDAVISCLRGDFHDQFQAHEKAAVWAEKNGAKLIFLSTANVFDAAPNRPHTENDTPQAVSEYGKYKIACEAKILGTLRKSAAIVRLPMILNRTKLERLTRRQILDEGALCGNFYKNLNIDTLVAGAVQFILEQNLSGIIHLGSSDFVREKDFLEQAAERFGFSSEGVVLRDFTDETYCQALGGKSTNELAATGNRIFYQVLETVRTDIPDLYHPSCLSVLEMAAAL